MIKKATKKHPGGWFKCTSCGTAKHASEFHKRSDVKWGIQSMCKTCKKTYDKQRLEQMKHREEPIKPVAIIEIPVPERLNWFERITRFLSLWIR